MEGHEHTQEGHKRASDSIVTFPPNYDPSHKPQQYRPSTREFVRPDIDLSLEQIFSASPRLLVALMDTRLRIQNALSLGLDQNATWEQIHKAQDVQRKCME